MGVLEDLRLKGELPALFFELALLNLLLLDGGLEVNKLLLSV